MTGDSETKPTYVSRGGEKLAAGLDAFDLHPAGYTCADFGCNVGGFTDCLLKRGAARVYAIDTGYGELAWTLRKHDQVVVMERTNAMHVDLPEPVDLVTIDVAWTRQSKILPSAARALKPGGRIVSLIKPHYEADRAQLRDGVLPDDEGERMLTQVANTIGDMGFVLERWIDSPIRGGKGNREFLGLIKPPTTPAEND